ncbi:FAD-dependent oxidoreductase [Kangsaoukella pontilimi]|nr:FAD-dependent oxidoreductase [Kangsaoukella pontilimi]
MDVVVIGAGLSGLTAAFLLQKAGADVQLIEADAQIGGRIFDWCAVCHSN